MVIRCSGLHFSRRSICATVKFFCRLERHGADPGLEQQPCFHSRALPSLMLMVAHIPARSCLGHHSIKELSANGTRNATALLCDMGCIQSQELQHVGASKRSVCGAGANGTCAPCVPNEPRLTCSRSRYNSGHGLQHMWKAGIHT